MASADSSGAQQPDAASQLSASRRDSDMASKLQNARSLTIQVLKEITDDFSEGRKIGQGTYGKVYLAKLENGKDIAVKLLHNTMPGIDDEQFRREFENLMRLDHQNIVRLVAYCYETKHEPMQYMGRTIFAEKTYRALCFEYMQNGSLQKHLSDECSGLDWNKRYKIIKGTCEGLKHLHHGFEETIYHLDLKPDNILLDKNMVPKLADFGLSKLSGGQQTMITQTPMGTIGYLPMEFLQGNIISSKFDIFSLGVVMIKIIGGHEAYARSAEMRHEDFLDLVQTNWRIKMLETCHASRPLEAYCQQVNICTKIALTCMEIDRHKRPNIGDIVEQLNATEVVIDKAFSWSESWSRRNGNLVNLSAFTGSEGILDFETRREFPVLVQVTAPPWQPEEEMLRAEVDIVVVFQTSKPLDHYVEEMGIVIDKLSSNDRLSLMVTGTQQVRLMELAFMTDEGKDNARQALRDYWYILYRARHPNDPSTAAGLFDVKISAGLREASEILRGHEVDEREGRVRCILLLSDSEEATTLTEGISPELPFPVHTIGLCCFDAYHDAETMKCIADKSFGTYSFTDGQYAVEKALELFMAGILKVAANSIKITLRAHEGITISSIESGRYANNVCADNLSGEIDIHDIYAGEQKNFIVYLTVTVGKKKLLTIGSRYRSLNAMSKHLTDADVFVMRPCPGGSSEMLAMHTEVAAELARIHLCKGIRKLVEGGEMSNIHTMAWHMDVLLKSIDYANEETMSRLRKYVDYIRESFSEVRFQNNFNPLKVPYLMSWLSSHEWQRATAKGKYYNHLGQFLPSAPRLKM